MAVSDSTMAGILASYDTELVENGNAEASNAEMTGWTSSGPVFIALDPTILYYPESPDGGKVQSNWNYWMNPAQSLVHICRARQQEISI